MKYNFAQNEYKKPVLKTHGTLEEMTQGSPTVGSDGSCPPGFEPSSERPGFCNQI